MRDIPHDILSTAYQMAASAGLNGNRDVIALVIGQAMLAERLRALRHVANAKRDIARTGDGSISAVRDSAMSIVDAAEHAIAMGVEH